MHTASKVRGRLGGRWFMAGALLCALVAAVVVAVEPSVQPAGAAETEGFSQSAPPVPTDPPAAPSGLTASLGGSSVSLSWTDPSDATISGYEYRIKTAGAANVYGAWTSIARSGSSTTTATIAVSGPGRRIVQLRATNAAGAGGHAVASTGVPDAPSGLRVSLSLNGNSVSLNWVDPLDSTISGYLYRVKVAGEANVYSAWATVSGSGSSTTSATIPVTGSGRRVVQLRATNAQGSSTAASASTGPPAIPSGFSTPGGTWSGTEGNLYALFPPVGSSIGSIVLNWSDPGDDSIIKYRYSFRPARIKSYTQWVDIPGSDASTTSHEFDLPTLEIYRIKIQAVNNVGTAGLTINVHQDWPVPAAPSGLKSSLSGSSVSLSWDNPFDDTVLGYEYRIKAAGAANSYSAWTEIAGSDASTTSHTIAVTGTERRVVQLRAVNIRRDGEPASASTGPPAKPSGLSTPGGSSSGTEGRNLVLTAAASSPKGSMVVSWSDPGDDSIIKYRYRLKVDRPGRVYTQWMDIAGSGASTTSHEFDLPTPERYEIKIQAVNGLGAADQTFKVNPAWPVPAAPSGLRASLSGNTVSLNWDDPYDHTVSRYQYRIKEAGTANSYSAWTNISGSNSSTTSHTVTVTGTERRVVQLRAANARGTGEPASASTGPPAAPSGFTTPGGSSSGTEGRDMVLTAATSSSKGSIVVSWSDPGDDSIIKYRYSVLAKNRYSGQVAHSNTIYSRWIDIPSSGASTTSHEFVLPTPEQYPIKIQAVNSSGAAHQTIEVTPAWTAPVPSPGLRATLSGGSVSLSWDNPYDASISGYQYRIKKTSETSYSAWTNIAGSSSSTTSAAITVVGTERRIVQLRANRTHNIGGHGHPATAWTAAPVTPAPPSLSVPDGPSGLKASGGNGVIDLSWSDPGDSTITSYQYQTLTGGSHTARYSAWQAIPSSSASTVSFTITNLAVDTRYGVRVRAGNAAGWGGYAGVSTRTGVTHAPAGVVTTPGDGSFTVSWAAPLPRYGITGYQFSYLLKPNPAIPRVNLPSSARSHTVTGLINGKQYEIRLWAISAAGSSAVVTVHAVPTASTSQ